MIYVLFANDMRSAHFEDVDPVAWAETEEELIALVAREKVAPYTEPGANHYGPTTWGKGFRKGGPLEWFNDPECNGGVRGFDDLVVIDGILHRAPIMAQPLNIPSAASVST